MIDNELGGAKTDSKIYFEIRRQDNMETEVCDVQYKVAPARVLSLADSNTCEISTTLLEKPGTQAALRTVITRVFADQRAKLKCRLFGEELVYIAEYLQPYL